MGERGLRAVKVFGDADVEEESIDLIGGGSEAGYLRREKIGLEGELLREVWRPWQAAAEDVGSGVDEAGTGAALFFEAQDMAVLNDDAAVTGDVFLVGDGDGERRCGLGVEAKHGGVIGVQVGVAVQYEHVVCCCVIERGADGSAGAKRCVLDGVMENHAAPGWAEVLLNDVVEMANGEDGARAARVAKLIEQNLKKRAASHGGHGLGDTLKLCGQARAETAGENNGFHRGAD
jgi:hypothetical protein